MYNSPRDSSANLNIMDPICTTLTTKGYLSDGNSHDIIINGGAGEDTFDVLRNKQILDLNGESGDDTFVVRSFARPVEVETGNVLPLDIAKTTVAGGDDDDIIDVQESPGNKDAVPEFMAQTAAPDYLVNSLVDIDGGTGTDTLVVVGTEFDDKFVIESGKVYGGGLSIKFQNIDKLDVIAAEGNDLISVLSTSPSFSTSLYGAKGSDLFEVCPRTVEPVVSKNLRGTYSVCWVSQTGT